MFSNPRIPGLIKQLPHTQQEPFTIDEVSQILEEAITQCSSDAYVIVTQPGLQLSDFTSFTNYGYLRAFMAQASTIVSFPHILSDDGEVLNVDFLESIISEHCHTQTYNVWEDDENEVPQYIDTRKRIIRVHLSPLPEDSIKRGEMLKEHDELLKRIVRKIPSPYYSMFYTTESLSFYDSIPSTPGFDPNVQKETKELATPELLANSIFPDITLLDKTRMVEMERNEIMRKKEPFFNSQKIGKVYQEKLINDIYGETNDEMPSVFDKQLIVDNAFLIMAMTSLVMCFFTYLMIRGMFSLYGSAKVVKGTKVD